ncbi:MAG: ecotin [Thiothrix nivea]|nr:MAG: ecotin [Thiothrix nivea]
MASKSLLKILFITLAVSLTLPATAQEHPDPEQALEKFAPYPKPKQGHRRHAIYLPPLPNEDNAKVELIIGKVLQIGCNHNFFSAELREHDLQGWGYPYYVVQGVDQPASTLMACPDSQKHNQFVPANLNIDLIRYNSRLPVVVYAPADIQVKYRIWKAGNTMQNALNK